MWHLHVDSTDTELIEHLLETFGAGGFPFGACDPAYYRSNK